MRRRVPLLVAVLVFVMSPAPVSASCGGPAPGETPAPPTHPVFTGRLIGERGEGTAGTLFDFEVHSVLRGDLPDRVTVDIAVDRTFPQTDGTVVAESSSISIGRAPVAGNTYRVEAYVGTPGGRERLFVNVCGGSLRLLSVKPGFWDEWGAASSIAAAASALALGLVVISRRAA